MNKTIIELIDKIPEIQKCFSTKILGTTQERMQSSNKKAFSIQGWEVSTIYDNKTYLEWKAELEYELDKLPQDDLIQAIKDTLKKIRNGFSDERLFNDLSAKLNVLKKVLLEKNEDANERVSDVFEENKLCKNILRILTKIQSNRSNRGKSEDELNTELRDFLDEVYPNIQDQTRQGESESGKDAGELDIFIRDKDKIPLAIIEALKLDSVRKNEISKHVNKLIENYNPAGCRYLFIIIYYTGQNLANFWANFIEYMETYNFSFETIQKINTEEHCLTNSKHGKVILKQNEEEVVLHFYAVNMMD